MMSTVKEFLARKVVVFTVLFLFFLDYPFRSDAWYYSTECNDCFADTVKYIESDFIYASYLEAWDACWSDCREGCGSDRECLEDSFREPLTNLLEDLGRNLTAEIGLPCQFDQDEEVVQAVDQDVDERQNFCPIACSASQSNETGLFKYHSDWTHLIPNFASRIWGKCQKWECQHCEHNKEACRNNFFCLRDVEAWDIPCPFTPSNVIPPDSITDDAIRNCLDYTCVFMEEICQNEWRVCHDWCQQTTEPTRAPDEQTTEPTRAPDECMGLLGWLSPICWITVIINIVLSLFT